MPTPTYNLSAIFDLALTGAPLPNPEISEGAVVLLGAATDRPRGLRILNGRTASETIADLSMAIGRLNDPAEQRTFQTLEPSNMWGTAEDARRVMAQLLDAAKTYPDHVWEIH